MKKVIAVLVSYNPVLDLLQEVLHSLCPQVARVVIVDNGSRNAVSEWIESSRISNVDFIPMGCNNGVGAALNAGISRARELGAHCVLLMDQDSVPRAAMVAELKASYAKLVAAGHRVAAIGPRVMDCDSGRVSSHARFARLHVGRVACAADGKPVEVDFLITSGSLIPMAVLTDVGGMDEGLFIDHVDTEWVLRAKARGYRAFGDCMALMEHSLGECRRSIWFFRWREVPVHAPFRYYYIFRNSVLLYRRPYIAPEWKRVLLVRLIQIVGFVAVVGPQRGTKLAMIWRGLWDGCRGRHGARPTLIGET